MRSRRLLAWYILIGLLVMESVMYKLSDYMTWHYRRALVDTFNTGAATQQAADHQTPYADLINKYAAAAGLNARLVACVIQAESSFQPQAVSPAGAYGLMQIIPGTWREVNSRVKACDGRHQGECTSKCYFNPQLNIQIGTAYLSQLYQHYSGNAVLALAAYNAGPGAVDKYGGIPPYRETEQYVSRIISYWHTIQGQAIPDYPAKIDSWETIRKISGWSLCITSFLILLILRRLFRHYRSWRWR